jgi:hypothetical protein
VTDDTSGSRLWQEIAAEAAREKDPERLLKLTKELELALDERDKKLRAEKAARKSA